MSSSTESPPSSPGGSLPPLLDGHSSGLPSPTPSNPDNLAPHVTDIGQLSDGHSSDWTGSDKASDVEDDEEEEAGFHMISSTEIETASSAGRSSASASSAGDQRMRLSFPDPLTPSQELENEAGVNGYSLMLDVSAPPDRTSVSPAPSSAHPRSSTESVEGDVSANEDLPPSVSAARKAQTSAWVERVKPNIKTKSVVAPAQAPPTKAEVAGSTTDLAASELTVGSASTLTLSSVSSDATVVLNERAAKAEGTAIRAKSPLSRSIDKTAEQSQPRSYAEAVKVEQVVVKEHVKVDEPPKPSAVPSQLLTRTLVVLGTLIAVSAVRFLESSPSFANFPSTELATTAAVQSSAVASSVSPIASTRTAEAVEVSPTPGSSREVQPPVSSALAVVNSEKSLAVRPVATPIEQTNVEELIAHVVDFEPDENDWIDMEDDEQDEGLQDDEDEVEEEEWLDESEDEEDGESELLLDLLAGWAGVPELANKFGDLLDSVDDKLSPIIDSAKDFVHDTLADAPRLFEQARDTHRRLRQRGQKVIGRHAKRIYANVHQSALKPSRDFLAEAWKKAANDEPPLVKRKEDERWSVLGSGSMLKGLVRRGLQGERVLRNPRKLGDLIKSSYKSAQAARKAAKAAGKAAAEKRDAAILAAMEKKRQEKEQSGAGGGGAGGLPFMLQQHHQWRDGQDTPMAKKGLGRDQAMRWKDRPRANNRPARGHANPQLFDARRHSLSEQRKSRA